MLWPPAMDGYTHKYYVTKNTKEEQLENQKFFHSLSQDYKRAKIHNQEAVVVSSSKDSSKFEGSGGISVSSG
jgi:hypothetical protein